MKNFLFLIALAAWSAGCGNTTPPAGNAPEGAHESRVQLSAEQLKNAGIRTGRAVQRQMNTELNVNGTIDVPPQNLVSVSFPLGGYLKSTALLPGMPVRRGQSIAVLEDPQYIQLQQDYLTAAARLKYAESEWRRQQELNTGKAGSDKALQQAEAEFATQRILVKALAEKLRLIGLNPETLGIDNLSRTIQVHAPIDGFVSAVHVNIGKYVNPTDVLFELVDPRDIHLNLTVFEKDVPALQVGQRITAFTNDRPDVPHPGAIMLIGRNINEQRAVEVHCHFDHYDHQLLPGMFMQARIQVANPRALAVPESAIVRWENRYFVFVETAPGVFDMTEVETGVSAEGFVQILPKGETNFGALNLALENAYALLMKLKNASEE